VDLHAEELVKLFQQLQPPGLRLEGRFELIPVEVDFGYSFSLTGFQINATIDTDHR
jgi:hypothetical protein